MLARPRPGPRRRGNLMLVSLFAILALLLMAVLLVNVGKTTAAKMDAQNAADAAAQAAGLTMARSMNSLVAIQHLIGEIHALDILAFSFGGKPLEEEFDADSNDPITDQNERRRLGRLVQKKATLEREFSNAMIACGGSDPAGRLTPRSAPDGFLKPVDPNIVRGTNVRKSGGAIGQSRERLLDVLIEVYRVHAAAGALARGEATSGNRDHTVNAVNQSRAAWELERNVLFEWSVLNRLEDSALNRWIALKQLGNALLIPQLHKYCQLIFAETKNVTGNAATALGSAADPTVTGFLAPREPRLPVRRESDLLIRDRPSRPDRSQLVRATTPWVQYWRKPILDFGNNVLPISGFAEAYRRWSDHFTIHMSTGIGTAYEVYLYIMNDTDYQNESSDKGEEPWAKGDNRRADELFTLRTFASRPAPRIVGFPLFRNPQPNGTVATAQVMVYNPNLQRGKRDDQPHLQPRVGWDTLGWDGDVPEWSYSRRDRASFPQEPRLRLNWQSKLTPVTRFDASRPSGDPDLNEVLDRSPRAGAITNTQ